MRSSSPFRRRVCRVRRITPLACALTLLAAPRPCQAEEPLQVLRLTPQAVTGSPGDYRLLPTEAELVDGNAAVILLRMIWEQQPYMEKVYPTIHEYVDLPLDDPRLRQRPVLPEGFFAAMQRAALRRDADWEYPLGEEPAYSILLPDVQGMRTLVGRGLAARARYHIAHGELDRAIEALRVGFANSRHIARTPVVIIKFVAIAMDQILLDQLQLLLTQKDAPNLYWALSGLPSPTVEMPPALEMEHAMLEMSVEGLENLNQARSDEQWQDLARRLIQTLVHAEQFELPDDSEREAMRERVVAIAREELVALSPVTAEEVARMSDAEAGIRWFMRIHDRYMAHAAAYSKLRPPVALPRFRALRAEIDQRSERVGFEWPAVNGIRPSTYYGPWRLQRRIEMLRTVEAIRDHAARHEGRLPERLEEITELPLPLDPLTAAPFHYRRENGSALLWAEGLPEDEGLAKDTLARYRYRLEVAP